MSSARTDRTVQFRALQLANEHRNAYGLRYNDHNRYRKHCVNRAHRLRSILKMTHGKGREFKKLPPIAIENIQAGHLQLLLFESERCWAYSQELFLASIQSSNASKSTSLRHSSTARFRRSVHWAFELLTRCQALESAQRLSVENLLEVSAYALIIRGKFMRFREEFGTALNHLSVAREILDVLATNAETSRDQALATFFSDEISPEIRHCAHEQGHTKSYNIDLIVKETSPMHREELVPNYEQVVAQLMSEGSTSDRNLEGRKRLRPVYWEGLVVPIRNPELVDVLLKVQVAEAILVERQSGTVDGDKHTSEQPEKGRGKGHKSRSGVAAFDAILSSLSDAEVVTRKLVEAQQISGSAPSGNLRDRDINFVHSYIVFQLLSRRIQRDLILVSMFSVHSQSATRKQAALETVKERADSRINPAAVKILDTVLQSLTQMRTLNVVDENPDLANAVETRISFTKGRRCLYLSRAYAMVKKYAEALALIQRAHLHLREVKSLLTLDVDPINAGSPMFYTIQIPTITDLESTLSFDQARLKQEWFAYNGGSVSSEKDTSKKPIFFDIALNYVQLDTDGLQERAGIRAAKIVQPIPKVGSAKYIEQKSSAVAARAKMEEVQKATTPEPAQQARGLSSLLGSWWGRK